jgi:hypothetical protein
MFLLLWRRVYRWVPGLADTRRGAWRADEDGVKKGSVAVKIDGVALLVPENGSLAHRRLGEVGGFKGAAAERNGSSVHSEDEEDCRRYLCFLLAVLPITYILSSQWFLQALNIP